MSKISIVIKVGTSSLFSAEGVLNEDLLRQLVKTLSNLSRHGYAPLLVFSGAVARGKLSVPKLITHQAKSARGQLLLISELQVIAQSTDVQFALFLISHQDMTNRDRYDTFQKAIKECLSTGLIPVINENDALTVTGNHNFHDNDQVATIMGIVSKAERIFLLTDVAGVFTTADGKSASGQTPIKEVKDVSAELLRIHLGAKSGVGRGGMEAKLRAARLASFVGITTHILGATEVQHILEIIKGRKSHGTVCLPWPKPIILKDRNRWLLAAHTSSASIQVDQGATQALRSRKSLLAVGITRIFGDFNADDIVEVIDSKRCPVALGVSALSSVALAKLLNKKTRPFNVEVIHADNLTLLPV